jgi:hypothetical protein
MAQKLRAVGVARMHDNEQAVLVCFDRKPTDDELRDVHDTLAGRISAPSAGLSIKHIQDAPRVKRNTFKVPNPHPNAKPEEIEVVFSSFAACIEREANALRTFAPSATERRCDRCRAVLDAAGKCPNSWYHERRPVDGVQK